MPSPEKAQNYHNIYKGKDGHVAAANSGMRDPKQRLTRLQISLTSLSVVKNVEFQRTTEQLEPW